MPHLPLTAQSEAAASEEPGAIGGFDTFGAQRLKAQLQRRADDTSCHELSQGTGMYRDVPGCTGMYRDVPGTSEFNGFFQMTYKACPNDFRVLRQGA